MVQSDKRKITSVEVDVLRRTRSKRGTLKSKRIKKQESYQDRNRNHSKKAIDMVLLCEEDAGKRIH